MSVNKAFCIKLFKSVLKELQDFLYGQLENKQVRFLTIYFLIISILEWIAYSVKSKNVTVIASKLWLIGGIFCLSTIIFYFISSIKSDLSHKNYISIIGIIGVIIFLLYLCGNINYTDINPDAAQQAAAGLKSFALSDLNYTGKAFLGYPNRQYVLVAIPALLFGRSIWTLHLGFALPFILGIITFYSGLQLWAYKKGNSGKYAIITIMSLFAFRFVTEYYINFEQAILPISITMILIGLFLILLCKPNTLCVVSIAWAGCLCSNSYTPVLAFLVLLLVFVSLIIWLLLFDPKKLPFQIKSKLHTVKILLAMNANILISFIATMLGKRSDRITQIRDDVDIAPFSWNCICDFLTDKNAVFMGFMGMLVIIYIIASLTMQFKVYDLLISLWVLGVFIATNLLIGYTAYSKAWIMQRALIVIPVLITGMTLSCYDLIQKYRINIKNQFIKVIIISFVLIGIFNFMQINQSFTYFNNIQPIKYMLSDLETTTKENGLSHEDTFNFVLYTDNVLMQNPADYFKFLYPNANVYIGVYGKYPDGVDKSISTIIYGEKDITNMTPSNDIKLVKYKNMRYALTGTWYKIMIIN